MKGVEPAPGRESFIVVLTVKLKSFYVIPDDMFEFYRVLNVLDSEPALIVSLLAVDYFLILNLKLLDLSA